MLDVQDMPAGEQAAETPPSEWLLVALMDPAPQPPKALHARLLRRWRRTASLAWGSRHGRVAMIIFGAALVITGVLAAQAYALPLPL